MSGEEFRIKTAVVANITRTSKYDDLLKNKLGISKLNTKGELEGPCVTLSKSKVVSVRTHAKKLSLPIITRRADKNGDTFNVWRVESHSPRKASKK